jgi:hypothetical protein
MTPSIKNAIKSMLFYGYILISILILNKIKPTVGHDFGGLGTLLMILILPFISSIMLLVNIYALVKRKQPVIYSILIHVVVLLLWLIFLFKDYLLLTP